MCCCMLAAAATPSTYASCTTTSPQHCGTKLRTDQQRLSVFVRSSTRAAATTIDMSGQRTKKHESTLHKHNIGHCPPVQMTLTRFASSSKRNLTKAHGLTISSAHHFHADSCPHSTVTFPFETASLSGVQCTVYRSFSRRTTS